MDNLINGDTGLEYDYTNSDYNAGGTGTSNVNQYNSDLND